VASALEKIKQWFRRSEATAEEDAEGGRAAATPPGGAERETSTNAQTAGASDEPWPGNG
jgi:hypothetical protein